jgi:hypothetical protein
MMPTDEYGNTYTSEPGYQGSAASPLPPARAAEQPRKPLDITPKAKPAPPRAKPRSTSVPLPRARPAVASSESSFAKRPVASSESSFAKRPVASSPSKRSVGDYPGRTGLVGSLFGALAGHNPPKPTHAHPAGRKAGRKAAGKAVPRHIKGRGLISAKAMAAMGEKLAERAVHAKPGMSPTGKHGAAAARPEKGQHKPPAAKPRKGQLDSAYAESPVE